MARLNFFLPDPLPRKWLDLLGSGPPPALISVALLIYTFSALILVLARIAGGVPSFQGWSQLGYLAAFYLFYALTGSLADNFWAVFASGFTILGLEYFHHWNMVIETE